MTCGECKFYDGHHCLRYAPKPVIQIIRSDEEEEFEHVTIWPEVFESDWCGEFVEFVKAE